MIQVLLLAGRSGAGKTTVSYAICDRLRAAGVAHCLVDGDNLDAAYPLPAADPDGRRLTAANLAALWRNYAAAGQHRMIYVNTNSVLDRDLVLGAVGGDADVTGVLLTAANETVHRRLSTREIGGALAVHVERSAAGAARLAAAGAWVHRIGTDGRTVEQIAADVVAAAGWVRADLSGAGR